MIALLLTGLIFVIALRDALSHSLYRQHWLLPLDNWLAPTWVWAANIAFYAYMIWLCVLLIRIAKGIERIVVAGWFVVIVIGPIKHLVSQSAIRGIQQFDAVILGVATVAAILILRERLQNARS